MSIHDFGTLHRALEEQDFSVEKTNGGHYKYTSPDGQVIFGSSTPSDHRSFANDVALLSRAGFDKKQVGKKTKSRPRPGAASDTTLKLVEYLQGHPNQYFVVQELEEAIGVNHGTRIVPNALNNIKASYPVETRRTDKKGARTEYGWIVEGDIEETEAAPQPDIPTSPLVGMEVTVDEPESSEAPLVPTVTLPTSTAPTMMYESVAPWPGGGVLIVDENGFFWAAVPVVPSQQLQTPTQG